MTNRKEVYIMTPASQLKPELITLTQYEALPEDKRVEVFEGTMYNMAGISRTKRGNAVYSLPPSMSSCPTPRLQSFNRTSWLSVTKIN